MLEINNYSIGIVTYLNRFDSYFKPNIKNLKKYFPDKEIVVIINGHPDKFKNLIYLKNIINWLTLKQIKYITFENHQSLAKCWNWILLMSTSNNILFLNDDVLIKKKFRSDFEKHLNYNVFFTINNSFSHFFINKKIVEKTGWFDERFLGIGEEDGDFLIRMSLKKIPLQNIICRDVINYVAIEKNPSFKEISKNKGKYSEINREFFDKKWYLNLHTSETFQPSVDFFWNNEEWKARQKKNMETPCFYPFSLLRNNDSEQIFNFNIIEQTFKFKKNLLNRLRNLIK